MYIDKPVKPFITPDSPPTPPHREQEYLDQISIWSFLKEKKVQIQTIFLILLAIITMNYILDAHIIIRGLIPSDIIWREFFRGIFGGYRVDTSFLRINPILLFIGLATIGPISYYLTNELLPDNFIKKVIRSLVLGIISLIACFSLIVLLLFFTFFFFSLILVGVVSAESEIAIIPGLTLTGVLYVLMFLIGSLIFQRFWVFLIFQGSNPDLGLRDQIKWTRKAAPKGQFGFILLLFLHISLQTLLFLITLQPEEEYYVSSRILSPDPILFLVLSGFEIGFYLLLILYQIVQFKKQKYLFSEVIL